MKVNGFVMAHDQDIWIGQVIRNVMEVVDELIVLHHTSSDNTRDEIEKAISGYSHARICEFKELRKGHTHVAPYAGKDCWAWQIDGDELYDTAGLQKLADECRSGKHSKVFRIQGRYLHATEYDQENNTFTGHLHPKEIKCGANFYNMKIMKEWPADLRRTAFMSKPMILKDGYDLESSHKDNQFCEWEDSLMRCVHVRFLQQSSNEKEDVIGKRLSPQQTLGYRLSPKDAGRNRKYNLRNIYRQGPITTIDASNFINKA